MTPIATVIIVLIAGIVILAAKSLIIVPQSETRIIERLGRYHATFSPGIHIIVPFIDRAKSIIVMKNRRYQYSSIIDLREQVYDFDRQNVITRDNVQTEINALLYFQIVDPFKAVYEIENLPNAIEKLTQTTLRNIIGELELDETLTSRDTINTKLRAVLDDATDKWGVKVNRVELQDITPPATVLNAMEKQMQAERNKRALILESEGEKASAILQSEGEKAAVINTAEAEKQKAILEAEGQAEARIRRAEAEAIAIQKITEAVGECTNPANYLLAQKYIQMLQNVAEGTENKTVFLPYEASNLLGSLGGIKELFQDANGSKAGSVPPPIRKS
ncbi:MAG: SPFH/Band 7/PHB domain protein [Bacteroidaceae bacterium]|nr:SPFH/Band 7/PHB domain protein [Bacteroidaceae bacterium]MBQ7664583.1 SPFH/Band 7/PHB domain protein [Bacteroidaceae bacterium]